MWRHYRNCRWHKRRTRDALRFEADAEDLLPLMRGWHQSAVSQPYLDLVADGYIECRDLMMFGATWNPPNIVFTADVTVHPASAEVHLSGILPGSNYCEVEPGSVTLDVRYDEDEEVFILTAALRFGLEVCGCPPEASHAPKPFVGPEGDPVPFEVIAPLDQILAPGSYTVEVFANGAAQSASTEFTVEE